MPERSMCPSQASAKCRRTNRLSTSMLLSRLGAGLSQVQVLSPDQRRARSYGPFRRLGARAGGSLGFNLGSNVLRDGSPWRDELGDRGRTRRAGIFMTTVECPAD